MTGVTTYYLQMLSPDELKPKPCPAKNLRVAETAIPQYQLNRFFYETVGAAWQWRDKLTWDDEQWRLYAERPELHLYIAYVDDTPAGYFELEEQDKANVEISYFGLLPTFIGQGLGGCLLTHALQSAWSLPGTQRVWVHTCSLDHEGALANYQARGMKQYQTTTE